MSVEKSWVERGPEWYLLSTRVSRRWALRWAAEEGLGVTSVTAKITTIIIIVVISWKTAIYSSQLGWNHSVCWTAWQFHSSVILVNESQKFRVRFKKASSFSVLIQHFNAVQAWLLCWRAGRSFQLKQFVVFCIRSNLLKFTRLYATKGTTYTTFV